MNIFTLMGCTQSENNQGICFKSDTLWYSSYHRNEERVDLRNFLVLLRQYFEMFIMKIILCKIVSFHLQPHLWKVITDKVMLGNETHLK